MNGKGLSGRSHIEKRHLDREIDGDAKEEHLELRNIDPEMINTAA